MFNIVHTNILIMTIILIAVITIQHYIGSMAHERIEAILIQETSP